MVGVTGLACVYQIQLIHTCRCIQQIVWLFLIVEGYLLNPSFYSTFPPIYIPGVL